MSSKFACTLFEEQRKVSQRGGSEAVKLLRWAGEQAQEQMLSTLSTGTVRSRAVVAKMSSCRERERERERERGEPFADQAGHRGDQPGQRPSGGAEDQRTIFSVCRRGETGAPEVTGGLGLHSQTHASPRLA